MVHTVNLMKILNDLSNVEEVSIGISITKHYCMYQQAAMTSIIQ